MLEKRFDQAAGLSALKLRPPTRVLPVVQNTEGVLSLELMWRLERALKGMGLSVAVVEGTHGMTLRDAAQGHQAVLGQWLEGVPAGAVVLLHAPLEALAVLLADSDARPLIPLSEAPSALVQAYNAVKVLWQVAALMPVVLLVPEVKLQPSEGSVPVAVNVQSLLTGCERHLGRIPALWTLEYDSPADAVPGHAEEACVLKVLDTALVLENAENRYYVDIPSEPSPNSAADQIIGVSDVHRQRHA